MAKSPKMKLSNGLEMPMLGLGTSKSNDDVTTEAVKFAIDSGYRLFDCAWRYQNQKAVGKGIRAKIEDGTVKREELFITSKLWRTFHRKEHMDECVDLILSELGLDYIDMLMIHFPQANAYKDPEEYKQFPFVKSPEVLDEDVHYTETWDAMQKFVEDGRARMLGVCNFNAYQIKRLLNDCKVKPVVNQVEVHPYLTNVELVNVCQSNDIAVTAFCSIGTFDRSVRSKDAEFPMLLEDPTLKELARKYGKTCAQIALRFSIERSIAVIPKSVTPSRILENMDVFDFELCKNDVEKLLKLNRNHRYMASVADSNHKYHPFRDNYSE